MKRIYPKLLKKLTIQNIKKIRELYRSGWSARRIADRFKVSRTTIDWHIGSLKRPEHIEIP